MPLYRNASFSSGRGGFPQKPFPHWSLLLRNHAFSLEASISLEPRPISREAVPCSLGATLFPWGHHILLGSLLGALLSTQVFSSVSDRGQLRSSCFLEMNTVDPWVYYKLIWRVKPQEAWLSWALMLQARPPRASACWVENEVTGYETHYMHVCKRCLATDIIWQVYIFVSLFPFIRVSWRSSRLASSLRVSCFNLLNTGFTSGYHHPKVNEYAFL